MMHSKKIVLSNFSRAISSESLCFRPDTEKELSDYIKNKALNSLPRGAGLSYNDSCLNSNGTIINNNRLNHLIHFDSTSGILQCQGGVRFKDLFLVHPDFIPPVIPGTLHATVAGGVAHDVHGKNNSHEGSFGKHLISLELLIQDKTIHCSRSTHPDLFHATIAGLGLTGFITRMAMRLKKASRFLEVENTHFDSYTALTQHMSDTVLNHDYQVAWLDLLNPGQLAIVSGANQCRPFPIKTNGPHTVPKLPFGLIKSWNMKLFNQWYRKGKKAKEEQSLQEFNNPLDQITHWNRLYGPQGLVQFQAVFDQDKATETIEELVKLIRTHKATPTLAVLKLLNQAGEGLLSFCKPGFTLAIDFIHNVEAKAAIKAMNQLINELKGRIYLAKDLFLNPEQYQNMYTNHDEFSQILTQYQCPMQSDLSQRLRITQ